VLGLCWYALQRSDEAEAHRVIVEALIAAGRQDYVVTDALSRCLAGRVEAIRVCVPQLQRLKPFEARLSGEKHPIPGQVNGI